MPEATGSDVQSNLSPQTLFVAAICSERTARHLSPCAAVRKAVHYCWSLNTAPGALEHIRTTYMPHYADRRSRAPKTQATNAQVYQSCERRKRDVVRRSSRPHGRTRAIHWCCSKDNLDHKHLFGWGDWEGRNALERSIADAGCLGDPIQKESLVSSAFGSR